MTAKRLVLLIVFAVLYVVAAVVVVPGLLNRRESVHPRGLG